MFGRYFRDCQNGLLFLRNCKQFNLSSFNQFSVIKGNKEPQKQRVNEVEQEEQEDKHSAFDFLNTFCVDVVKICY